MSNEMYRIEYMGRSHFRYTEAYEFIESAVGNYDETIYMDKDELRSAIVKMSSDAQDFYDETGCDKQKVDIHVVDMENIDRDFCFMNIMTVECDGNQCARFVAFQTRAFVDQDIFERGRAMGVFHTITPCSNGEGYFYRLNLYYQPDDTGTIGVVSLHPAENDPDFGPDGWDYDTYEEAAAQAHDRIAAMVLHHEAKQGKIAGCTEEGGER